MTGVIQVLQALSVPVIAVVGAYIGWQQLLISRVKLKGDLFDRRFAVFDSVRKFLSEIMREGDVPDKALWEYRAGIADAPFLLDDQLCEHFDVIWKRSIDLRATMRNLSSQAQGADRTKLSHDMASDLEWFGNQLTALVDEFKPFLKLQQPVKWPWQ
ncbi:hypothetical protein [Dongia sp.]|jgi:hypothetical protein|uniref:hypothetical protein n=1 Tax=Dongia sp. TaxID=1977262 RepID=UPI0035ADAFC6